MLFVGVESSPELNVGSLSHVVVVVGGTIQLAYVELLGVRSQAVFPSVRLEQLFDDRHWTQTPLVVSQIVFPCGFIKQFSEQLAARLFAGDERRTKSERKMTREEGNSFLNKFITVLLLFLD